LKLSEAFRALVRRVLPVVLSSEQHSQLDRWSRGGSTPYRLVIRSRIVLLASFGYSNREIARILNTNPITVARWRSRFALLGVEGIRKEAPRNGSPPPVSEEVVRRVIYKTMRERPRNRLHWSTRSLAREVGVSHSTVRRIWKSHGIRPNRSRVAELAENSPFRPKQIDLVGVYVNPPQRAAVISFGERLPTFREGPNLRPEEESQVDVGVGSPWMAELVTTLNLLDRRGPLHSSRRHINQEFLSFLRLVHDRRTGGERMVLLAEANGSVLSPQLVHWLHRHPQVSTELCLDSESWKRTVLKSIQNGTETHETESPPGGLQGFLSAAARWREESDDGRRPFAWSKDRSLAANRSHRLSAQPVLYP
jgi:transposase